jgi:plastocyanin
MKAPLLLAALVVGLTSCSAGPATDVDPVTPPATEGAGPGTPVVTSEDDPRSTKVDPRDGGLEIGLGEWALTLEAGAIRPGRVTFVVVNRGTIAHGFEIEAEGGYSSGHGSGDGLKAETRLIQPGERTRLILTLGPGLYKVECLVDGHDDRGMEGYLEVRQGAPLVRIEPERSDVVTIKGFAFRPPRLEVVEGTTVTWTNADPSPHTVTAKDGSFDSGTLEPGDAFTSELGSSPVTYVCQIHPEMRGELVPTWTSKPRSTSSAGWPSPDTPVLERRLEQHDRHVVGGNPDASEIADDRPVQGTLGLPGTTREPDDLHERVPVRRPRRNLAVLRCVLEDPLRPVLFRDREGLDERGVHRVEQLLAFGRGAPLEDLGRGGMSGPPGLRLPARRRAP